MIVDNTKTSPEEAKLDYDLTCWYINQRRVMELISLDKVVSQSVQKARLLGDAYQDIAKSVAAKDALIEWMEEYQPETLGRLLLAEKATTGTLFTHFSNFYCKGLAKRNRSSNAHPHIYCKVEGLGHDVRLQLHYNPEHLTAASSQEHLKGQQMLFVLGLIQKECDGVLDATPYVIATPIMQQDLHKASSKGLRWSKRLEVFIDGIDSFSLARLEPRPRTSDLSLLRDVSEKQVKQAFADINRRDDYTKGLGW